MAAIGRLGKLFKCGNVFFPTQITTIVNNKSPLLVLKDKFGQYSQRRELYSFLPWLPRGKRNPIKFPEPTEHEEKFADEIVQNINNQITTNNTSRLFAIVHICGKQFRVTDNDIIIVQGYWAPNPGDELTLEKVLMVAGTDFSLLGRPILGRELVNIHATVIEKTFSQTKIVFRYRKRKQYHRTHFNRTQHTMLRINSINVHGPIDKKKEVEGLDRIY